MTYRDPEESGLVTIYHPRGNGTDNSPRWDAVLENVEVGEVGAYPRYDLQRVTDPSHRPTYAEYDRYLWLVNLIKRAGCDEATIYETQPFSGQGRPRQRHPDGGERGSAGDWRTRRGGGGKPRPYREVDGARPARNRAVRRIPSSGSVRTTI